MGLFIFIWYDITTIFWNIIIRMLLFNLHQEPCDSIGCHLLVFPTETSWVQISPPSCKYGIIRDKKKKKGECFYLTYKYTTKLVWHNALFDKWQYVSSFDRRLRLA